MCLSGKKKILVVDDDHRLRNLLVGYLSASFLIDTASNGSEGLELFNKNRYDMVITDYNMPFMDGKQMASEILKKKGSFPIILMTGNTEVDSAGEPLTIIYKPFCMNVMLEKIEKIMAS